MADEVTVPSVPPLATLPGVELVQAGQWDISTGRVTFTSGDLASAVAALDCPAVRRPVLKLGHDEPEPVNGMRWDGEPAVGYVDNMALADEGFTIVGDYTGMPAWLGKIAASAYPDRSIEGVFDFRCQLSHTHPFVITAVALLGVVPPGVGTLQSLQDVAALYGVAAAADQAGERVAVTVHASKGDGTPMPNPRPLQISAAVSSEDVRRAYYENAPWSVWICEMQLDPLQLITVDDESGQYARVPIVLDGDTVTFGAAVPVRIEYVDMPAPSDSGTPAAAAAGSQRIVYATRAESRPGQQPPRAATPETPPAEPAEVTPTPEREDPSMALDEGLRERLGLPEDADEATILAALDEALNEHADPAPPSDPPAQPEPAPLPEGVVTIDATTLEELREQAAQGVAARAQQRTEARDRVLDDAVKAGKFPPARRAHWASYWDSDPEGAKQALASLAPGLVPLEDAGVPGGEDDGSVDDEFDRLFSTPAVKES